MQALELHNQLIHSPQRLWAEASCSPAAALPARLCRPVRAAALPARAAALPARRLAALPARGGLAQQGQQGLAGRLPHALHVVTPLQQKGEAPAAEARG